MIKKKKRTPLCNTVTTPPPLCRERQEREEAEREGRQVQEEEPDDENVPSPFQPIGNVVSEVRRRFRSQLSAT